MSGHKRSSPGSVVQHGTGAGTYYHLDRDNTCEPYTTQTDLQRKRRLRNRFGVSDTRSSLIAALVFGEVKR